MDLSEGVFLHASLTWANFHKDVVYWSSHVVEERLEAVKKISRDAVSYYCALLERIPKNSEKMVRKAFIWIMGTQKPLDKLELQHAIAIDSSQESWSDLVRETAYNFESRFENMFGYLLTSGRDGIVSFTHQTIKEILISSPGTLSSTNEAVLCRFRVWENNINTEIGKACLALLNFSDFTKENLKDSFGSLADTVQTEREIYRLQHNYLQKTRRRRGRYNK